MNTKDLVGSVCYMQKKKKKKEKKPRNVSKHCETTVL